MVVHALTGGCGVVVLSSGYEGISFRLARCGRQELALKAVASVGAANWNRNTTILSLLMPAVVGDIVAADEVKAGGWMSVVWSAK